MIHIYESSNILDAFMNFLIRIIQMNVAYF